MAFPAVLTLGLFCACAASVPANAVRVRVGDCEYALASKTMHTITIAGRTPQPGQATAQMEITNRGAETVTCQATIVIRGSDEDQTVPIGAMLRAGWSTPLFVPYDSRGSEWRFGVKRDSGEILWLE